MRQAMLHLLLRFQGRGLSLRGATTRTTPQLPSTGYAGIVQNCVLGSTRHLPRHQAQIGRTAESPHFIHYLLETSLQLCRATRVQEKSGASSQVAPLPRRAIYYVVANSTETRSGARHLQVSETDANTA